jgi:hypothetical protein
MLGSGDGRTAWDEARQVARDRFRVSFLPGGRPPPSAAGRAPGRAPAARRAPARCSGRETGGPLGMKQGKWRAIGSASPSRRAAGLRQALPGARPGRRPPRGGRLPDPGDIRSIWCGSPSLRARPSGSRWPGSRTGRHMEIGAPQPGQPRSSTISTRCGILLIMPRTEGVSSSSRVLCILFRPRPISVWRWISGRRIGRADLLDDDGFCHGSQASSGLGWLRPRRPAASSRLGRMSATFLPRRCATWRGLAACFSPSIVARIML